MSIEQVIELHQQQEYRVYAIGFAPGFAYLGEVDERIAAPRLATPRQKVPRGAVAIADRQTAVYPAVSPGGWNLIGRSPMRITVGDNIGFYGPNEELFRTDITNDDDLDVMVATALGRRSGEHEFVGPQQHQKS